MKIVYVSHYFPPEMGAPAARVSELARQWAAAGHQVCVLTGFPNHPTGIIPEAYRGRVRQRERWFGVDVLRTWVYASPNRGIAKRTLSFLSFAASSVVLGAMHRDVRDADVVIATSPQFFCAVGGWALARIVGAPFVLEIRDLWPQCIVELGVLPKDHPGTRVLEAIEQFLYRSAELLVSVTESYTEVWRQQGHDPAKMRVVKNGVDLEMFVPGPKEGAVRERLGLSGKFVVSYVGTHGISQKLETLLEVADVLREEPDVHFLLVGEGAEKAALQEQAAQRGLTNVTFLGQQPRDSIPEFIAASDLVAVVLQRMPLFEKVIPSKIFEIMGCARPILLAVAGEAREIIEQAGSGYLAQPQDVAGIVAQIRLAKADPKQAEARGLSGRAYVEKHFDRRQLAMQFLDDLRDVARGGNAA
ncbi:MAG: glycosyltransferase family 4 protein [Nannocystaceae bacterium]|nr:glycosyltransferase family 4 protein [Nannocystaceae bacterium]